MTQPLHEKIKEIRKSKGMTQKEVADQLGVNQQTYSKYERGDLSLGVERLKELSEIFDTSIENILGTEPKQDEAASTNLLNSDKGRRKIMELQQILMKIMELSFKINTETKYCVTSNYCGYSNSIHVSVLKDKESIGVTLFSNLYFYESEHGDYGKILNYLKSLLND